MSRLLKISLLLSFFSFLLFNACQQMPEIQVDMDLEVPNLGLHDHQGDFHQLYYYGDQDAVVLFTQGNGCSYVRDAIEDLKSVRKTYKKDKVKFFLINSNQEDDRNSIVKETEKYDMEFPVLIDDVQLAAEALQLHRTAEVLVLDPATWTVSYRGPIKDGKTEYLDAAIKAQKKGEILATNYVKGKGTAIKLEHPDKTQFASISYEMDVAPILIEKCRKCHVEGGIAPWQMKDHAAVLGWSNMMREVLRTKRMPPWQADPHYGTFEHDLSLSKEELQTIIHWIDAGAKKGEGADPLASNKMVKSEWEMGTPQLVVTLDKEDIPASGIIDYRYQEVELDIDKDVWVTAFQVQPDNQAVLHHLLVSIIYPEGFVEPIDRRSPWLDGLLAAWAPGDRMEVFPENTGRILPKGSKLHFQLHYTASGKEESDQSTLGFYYTEEEPASEFVMSAAFNTDLKIPPHEQAYEKKAKFKFDEEITLYSLYPHMHYRGKKMKFTALYPDGSKEILLNVPNYNFNWQRGYRLKEPKVLPARTIIYVDAVYDNSAQNTFNPAPDKTVYWGDFSFDEMLVGYMSFEYGAKGAGGEELSMK